MGGMSDDLATYPADVPTWAEGIADLLGKLPDLVSEGHVSVNDARVIRYLADRPPAVRTARCPVCLAPSEACGIFHAGTDEELFAMVADHIMQVHNGGSADAFKVAEWVLPQVGAAYRKGTEAKGGQP